MNLTVEQLLVYSNGRSNDDPLRQGLPNCPDTRRQAAGTAVQIGRLSGLAGVIASADARKVESAGVFAYCDLEALARGH